MSEDTRMANQFEEVLLVTEFQDTVRAGIARYNGVPAYFKEQFDEGQDCFLGLYRITLLDPEVIGIACEIRQIEDRYWTAYYEGKSEVNDLPRVLPADRERFLDRMKELDGFLRRPTSSPFTAKAVFKSVESQGHGMLNDIIVCWKSISEPR